MEQLFCMRPKEGERIFLYVGLLDFIEEFLTDEMIGVEIGSYSGESSIMFADKVKKLYCIDTWDDKTKPFVNKEGITDDSDPMDIVESVFDNNTKRYNNIEKIKGYSSIISEEFDDKSLDFIYIDGGHRYEDVIEDLSSWYDKVKDGGIVSGHDFNSNSVKSAVEDFCGKKEKKISKLFKDFSWVFIK